MTTSPVPVNLRVQQTMVEMIIRKRYPLATLTFPPKRIPFSHKSIPHIIQISPLTNRILCEHESCACNVHDVQRTLSCQRFIFTSNLRVKFSPLYRCTRVRIRLISFTIPSNAPFDLCSFSSDLGQLSTSTWLPLLKIFQIYGWT